VLLDVAVKISLVFLLAAPAAIALRKSSAGLRHLIWGGAFLGFLLVPVLSVTVPKWQALPVWMNAANVMSGATSSTVSVPVVSSDNVSATTIVAPSVELADSGWQEAGAIGSSVLLPSDTSVTQHDNLLRPSNWILVVWGMGAALLLVRIFLSRFMLHRLLHSASPIQSGPIADVISLASLQVGTDRSVNAWLSSECGMPMTWGVFRTYLLLPVDADRWDRRRLRSVLLHELAHVKNYDTVTHVMAQMVCALYWFHPLVWIATRRLHAERERTCDDLVLLSGVRGSDYAEDLLAVVAQHIVPCAALAMMQPSKLEGRVKAILSEGRNRRSLSKSVFALTLAAGIVSATALAVLESPNHTPANRVESVGANDGSAPATVDSPPESAERVHVRCVDAGGKPVVGAQVYLFQHGPGKEGQYLQSGPFTSDADGQAVCAEEIFWSDDGNLDRWIYARIPGQLVGVTRSMKS
jgi:beta-lactamase regulating signal transducer with metallopeptidase domain